VLRSGTTAANIRSLIDTRGFREIAHAGSSIVTSQSSIDPTWPGSNLMIPGGITSTIPWGDLIRKAIEGIFSGGGGNGSGFQVPQLPPIPGGVLVPDPGTLGGPVPCGTRPKVAYITLPDGTVGCPSGYHPEKSGKGYCVRNRRMNALNPRALSRASRRVGGFARAVKRARTLKRICKTL